MRPSTSNQFRSWDIFPASGPRQLFHIVLDEAIEQKYNNLPKDHPLKQDDAFEKHQEILRFALERAFMLVGISDSWQPIVNALLSDKSDISMTEFLA